MKRILLNISACLVLLLAAACSTTKRLPEGEQLYIGIGNIAYTDHPKDRSARRDTAGVITSIGEAVKAVDRVLKGEGPQAAPTLSDEQRAAIKARIEADKKDFETVQEEVEAVLAYPPNNALFGSSKLRSPLQFGLWFYNGLADSRSKLGRWMFRKLATEPVLVSSVSPEMRAKVATNTLHNYGFFHGNVGYEVVAQKNPRKAKINYTVTAGPLFRLDSVAYVGFPSVADSLLRRTRRRRLLNRGDAFSVVNLSGEQTRIEQLLRENGYYFFSAPYVAFRADTFQRKNHVQLRVQPADGKHRRSRRVRLAYARQYERELRPERAGVKHAPAEQGAFFEKFGLPQNGVRFVFHRDDQYRHFALLFHPIFYHKKGRYCKFSE